MVNSRWGSDVAVLTHCSSDLELFSIKVQPFYLLREFNSVIIKLNKKTCARDDLYGVINGLENAHPEAASIVVDNFITANMRKV